MAAAAAGGAVPTTQPDPAVAAPPAPKPEDDLSARFATLTKREKATAERERKAAELEKKYGDIDKLAADKQSLALMKKFGITPDDLIQAMLKEGKPEEPKDKVQTLEEKLQKIEDERKAEADRSRQASIDKAVGDFKSRIKATIDSDAGKYELIAAHDALDTVFERCADYWSSQADVPPEERKHLDIAVACDQVEQELYDYAKSKFAGVKKYRSIYEPEAPAAPAPDIEKKASDTAPPQKEPTLTNRGTTPSAPTSTVLDREVAIKQIAAKYRK